MAYIFGSIWDRFNRNALNDLSKSVEQQGKSIQDLVAEGQLTMEQYVELLTIINSNLKSGEVGKSDLTPELWLEVNRISEKINKGEVTESDITGTLRTLVNTIPNKINRGEATFNDIDINKGKLLPKHLSEEVLKMVTGDAPVNAVPADGSITNIKLANKASDRSKLSDTFTYSGSISNDVSIDTIIKDGNYNIVPGNPGIFPVGESNSEYWCLSVGTTDNWVKQTLYKLIDPHIKYFRSVNNNNLTATPWKSGRELGNFIRRIGIDESIDTITVEGNYIVTSGNSGTFPNGANRADYYLKVEVINGRWVQQFLGYLQTNQTMYKRSFDGSKPVSGRTLEWERFVNESYLNERLQLIPDGSDGSPTQIKMLMVGNSYALNAVDQLTKIASSAGVDLTVGVIYDSGQSFSGHYQKMLVGGTVEYYDEWSSAGKIRESNVTHEYCIKKREWDIITFQTSSGTSFDYSKFQPHLQNLYDEVSSLSTNDNVEYGLHLTWSRGTPLESEPQSTSLEQYEAIANAYKNAMRDMNFGILLPTGTAIQNARTNPDLEAINNSLTRDNSHLDEGIGYYIAGLTILGALTSKSVLTDVKYIPETTETNTKFLSHLSRYAAQQAILNPYKVTEI